MARTILYVFAGREANMRLLMPFLHRIVEDHPNVDVDIWNLARKPEDAEFLQTLGGERVIVRNDFYQHPDGWNAVWRHYAKPEYQDTLFVKIDDDVVFFEADRFGEFLDFAYNRYPGGITTAQVVNNGACTKHDPELQRRFEALGIPLLDVHLSNEYARRSHEYFMEHWQSLVGHPLEFKVDMINWLSINFIAFDWSVAKFIGDHVGQYSPPHIRGRDWLPSQILGDEGAANLCDIAIAKGFMAAHLGFGPQCPTDEQLDQWRTVYESIGRNYLSRERIA